MVGRALCAHSEIRREGLRFGDGRGHFAREDLCVVYSRADRQSKWCIEFVVCEAVHPEA